MTPIVVLFGLVLLFLWLRGWWFAGLLVCLWLGLMGQGTSHGWFMSALIGFGPWLFWFVIRDMSKPPASRASLPVGRGELVSQRVLPSQNARWQGSGS